MKKHFFFIVTILFFWSAAMAQCPIDPITEGMECTSITVGKRASADGSVMTSHTDDSHRSRTNIMVEPAADHQKGEKQTLYKRVWAKNEPEKMARYEDVPVGEIDMPAHTYQFFNTAYPLSLIHI